MPGHRYNSVKIGLILTECGLRWDVEKFDPLIKGDSIRDDPEL